MTNHEASKAMREAAAECVEPSEHRPCACDRCDCGNQDDAQSVAVWDALHEEAKRIRALPLPAATTLTEADFTEPGPRVALGFPASLVWGPEGYPKPGDSAAVGPESAKRRVKIDGLLDGKLNGEWEGTVANSTPWTSECGASGRGAARLALAAMSDNLRSAAEIRAEIERQRGQRDGWGKVAALQWVLSAPAPEAKDDGEGVLAQQRAALAVARQYIERDEWPTGAKFPNGAHIRTKPGSKGAEWEGVVCGWYRSPPLTALGYAVRSAYHKGAVQIFAEDRLELMEKPHD